MWYLFFIEKHLFIICLGTAQKQFETLNKRYSRKKMNAKNKTHLEKELQIYQRQVKN